MKTILYFQSPSKINAAEKLSGVREIAAKCGWHIQVVEGLPSQKRLVALLLVARLRDKSKFRGSRRRTFGPLQVVRRASTRKLVAQDSAVADALELIRREACAGLSAQDVLKRFPCSRRQAEVRFRKAAGRSVLDEIHAVRLEFAKQLLSEKNMPLKVLSDFCGFGHPNSLRKFFKKQTGKSMTEWKRAQSPRAQP